MDHHPGPMPLFLPDAQWQHLVAAARAPADPHAAVAEVISVAVLPESCRADMLAHERGCH